MVSGRSNSIKGICCLLLGIAVFALQDVVIKAISAAYPLHEAMVLRSITSFPLLFFLVWKDGGFRTLIRPGWPWMLLRGVIACLAYTSYYLGLAELPIATCVALYFGAPLFITVMSIIFLDEHVGPRRWAAVAFGFLGVMIILRPTSDFFDWAAILPVLAGFMYAVAMIAARRLGATDTAPAMSTWSNAVFLFGALILSAIFGAGGHEIETHRSLSFLTRGWVTPNLQDFLLMASCGVIAALGLTLLTQAYRLAEANVVAPFEYTALIWSVFYGWLIWSDWPDASTWLGIAIIVGAGLYVFHREQDKPVQGPARPIRARSRSP
jgi:drug/metabolite transporter (DMT)-like permease